MPRIRIGVVGCGLIPQTKEELIHFAECVRDGRVPITSVEDGRADVAWLHRIWQARTPRSIEELRAPAL